MVIFLISIIAILFGHLDDGGYGGALRPSARPRGGADRGPRRGIGGAGGRRFRDPLHRLPHGRGLPPGDAEGRAGEAGAGPPAPQELRGLHRRDEGRQHKPSGGRPPLPLHARGGRRERPGEELPGDLDGRSVPGAPGPEGYQVEAHGGLRRLRVPARLRRLPAEGSVLLRGHLRRGSDLRGEGPVGPQEVNRSEL